MLPFASTGLLSQLISRIKGVVYKKTRFTILEHKHASKYLAEQQTCSLDTWQNTMAENDSKAGRDWDINCWLEECMDYLPCIL